METSLKNAGRILFLCIFIILVSCSSGTSYKILSIFFDGVPEPNSPKQTKPDSLSVNKAKPVRMQQRQSRYLQENFFHPPYKDKECADCHDIDQGFKLVDKMPDLCYTCHDDFSEEYRVLHGPVASGACTECHHPHLAKNEKLLKRSGQDLCLYCHNKTDIVQNEVHEDLDDENCTVCHNAHGGEDRYFLD